MAIVGKRVAPASCRLSRGRLALGAAGEDARRTAAGTAALLGSPPCKHFQQRGRNIRRSFCRHRSEHLHQSLPVYGTKLIQGYLPPFPLKPHRDPCGVGARDYSHGSDDDSPQMLVHFIGGDDQTRTGLLNLSPLGGIEDYEPDLILSWRDRWPTYHRHSLRSNSLGSAMSSMSSSCAAWPEARNASSQPWRGWRPGEMIRQSSATLISTVSPKPHCSMKGLGMRTPRELPMRTNSVFMPETPQ